MLDSMTSRFCNVSSPLGDPLSSSKGRRGWGWTVYLSPVLGAYLCEQMNGGSLMNYVLKCESQVAPL